MKIANVKLARENSDLFHIEVDVEHSPEIYSIGYIEKLGQGLGWKVVFYRSMRRGGDTPKLLATKDEAIKYVCRSVDDAIKRTFG